MARIPIQDVPNAPQFTPTPQAPEHSVNLGYAASLLKRDTIAQGSFDGPAEGLQAIGRGIANAGAGVGAWGKVMAQKQKIDDTVKVADANNALSLFSDSYAVELDKDSNKDTKLYEPDFVKGANETLQKILKDKTASPDAKARIQEGAQNFISKQAIAIRKRAVETSAKRGNIAYLGAAKTAAAQGDLATHDAWVDAAVRDNIIFEEAAPFLKENARIEVEGVQAKRLIAEDPKAARIELEEGKRWKSLPILQQQAFLEEAKRTAVQNEGSKFREIAGMIETFQIKDLDHIKEIDVKNDLDETSLLKLDAMRKQQIPLSYEAVSTLKDRADAVDPLQDKTGRQRFELERDAYRLPAPFREQVMTQIAEKYEGKAGGTVSSEQANAKINAAFEHGFLGEFKKQKVDEGDITETNKMELAYKKKLQLRDDVTAWRKANPKGNEAELNEFLNERFEAPGLKAKPEPGFFESIFQRRAAPSAPTPPVKDKDALKRILNEHTPKKTSALKLPAALQTHASDFKEAAQQYGLDPDLLAAISAFETAGGTSKAFREKKNAMGISDAKGPVALASVRDSIFRQARTLANPKGPYAGAKTIEEIAAIYAPPGASNDPHGTNIEWANGVRSWLSKIKTNT